MQTRGVAQLGRALRSGRRSRVFESRHPDSVKTRVSGDGDPCFYVSVLPIILLFAFLLSSLIFYGFDNST